MLLTVIIIVYRPAESFFINISRFLKENSGDSELIIVDNCPEAKTAEYIKSDYPQVGLIQNNTNRGFSFAVNQGVNKATGEYILVLNDDIIIQGGFFQILKEKIKDLPQNIGIIAPKILQFDGKTIDSTGLVLTKMRRFYDRGRGKLDKGQFDANPDVFGASACAVLYRRKALESIRYGKEYFDEDFFCIAEDVDLSWRLQKEGWKALYFPKAVCLHEGGISRKKSRITQYFSMRNRCLMVIKNESFLGFLRFPIIFLCYDLWRNICMLILNPRYFFKAFSDIVRLLPKMIKKRNGSGISDKLHEAITL